MMPRVSGRFLVADTDFCLSSPSSFYSFIYLHFHFDGMLIKSLISQIWEILLNVVAYSQVLMSNVSQVKLSSAIINPLDRMQSSVFAVLFHSV